MPPVDESRLPASLLERFVQLAKSDEQSLVRLLVFVSPVTTSSTFSRDGP
jgi:hypothetical protein